MRCGILKLCFSFHVPKTAATLSRAAGNVVRGALAEPVERDDRSPVSLSRFKEGAMQLIVLPGEVS